MAFAGLELRWVSVFNHYNRVRANIQTSEVEEDESGWSDDSQSDGQHTSLSPYSCQSRLRTNAGRTGVVPVHLNPHPRRAGSLPFQLRYSAPTFEKSNVLVLCVVPLRAATYMMIILFAEGRLVQVKTLINFGCNLKQPERREDATCENSSQSPRCSIFCQ